MTRAGRVISFIETFCTIPEGTHVGKPMVLEQFQKDFIIAIYDNPAGTKEAMLSIARKNGKTAFIAAILLVHLVGPEAKQNSHIVSGARSKKQAGIIFKLAVKMINFSEKLKGLTHVTKSTKTMTGLPMNVEFAALAAEGTTAMGESPALAILDEVGQVKGPTDDFVEAITTSQGAHENPLLISISTQAANDSAMFSIWIDDALESKDPHIVCHLYAADEGCKLGDVEQWKKANPALGTFRSLDDLAHLAEKAERMPTAENGFRNLNLNQRVSAFNNFITKKVWQSNNAAPDMSAFNSRPVYIGLDLSARNDLTALVAVCRDGDGILHVKIECYTPKEGLTDRSERDRTPYDKWVETGYLFVTPGHTVDYSVIAERLEWWQDNFDVEVVAFDRWRIDILKKEIERLGCDIKLEPFGQGFRDMSPALDSLESELLQGRVHHGEHPVLTMCMMNAVVIRDPAGSRKLDKSKSTARIDAGVALAMAVAVESTASETGSVGDYLSSLM